MRIVYNDRIQGAICVCARLAGRGGRRSHYIKWNHVFTDCVTSGIPSKIPINVTLLQATGKSSTHCNARVCSILTALGDLELAGMNI
jgi:hypothetical protein